MFADRLDFLMKLTGTSNSRLGRTAHVDASTISRLRAGKRELPKRQNFLPLMCDSFARAIETGYQRQSAAEAVCPGMPWPEEPERASALLLQWLLEEKPSDGKTVARLVSRLASLTPRVLPPSEEYHTPAAAAADNAYFYGNEGKRAAVTLFLSAVIAAAQPRTLLLYSDEGMDWLNEDESYARQWAGLMQAVIRKGNRIRIIHTVWRTLGEMLEALNKWLDVYMTGAVEPYYCPRLRDGISRRTLFIAPGLAAVAASSVGDVPGDMLNLYVRDGRAVQALEAEYARYFALCLPLMRILRQDHADEARGLLRELMAAEGDQATVQSAPALHTMPEEVARSLSARCGSDMLLFMRQAAANTFTKNAKRNSVYEMIPYADAVRFRDGGSAVSPLALAGGPAAFYVREEYAAHLTSMAAALEANPNYHVLLDKTPAVPANMALYHKTGAGTVILRTDGEPVVFAIGEARMNAAFSEYLARQATRKPENRSETIRLLLDAAQAARNG